jgi:hypothetical protein
MNSALSKKLKPFFLAKTSEAFDERAVADNGDRYWPQAFVPGNPGWGVFDRQMQRFLSDAETLALSDDDLMNAKVMQ